jgi:hypothetical protein
MSLLSSHGVGLRFTHHKVRGKLRPPRPPCEVAKKISLSSPNDVNRWRFTQLRSVTHQLRSKLRSLIFQKPLDIAILYTIIRNIRSKKGIWGEIRDF